jgi:hypothetical protein
MSRESVDNPDGNVQKCVLLADVHTTSLIAMVKMCIEKTPFSKVAFSVFTNAMCNTMLVALIRCYTKRKHQITDSIVINATRMYNIRLGKPARAAPTGMVNTQEMQDSAAMFLCRQSNVYEPCPSGDTADDSLLINKTPHRSSA